MIFLKNFQKQFKTFIILVFKLLVFWIPLHCQDSQLEEFASVKAQINIEPKNPWLPPFGSEQIGGATNVTIYLYGNRLPVGEFILASFLNGKESFAKTVSFNSNIPLTGVVSLETEFDKLVLFHKDDSGDLIEIAHREIQHPSFEASVIAKPDSLIHPVDLGTIMVPEDWLLLAGGQNAKVGITLLHRGEDRMIKASLWFNSSSEKKITKNLQLVAGKVLQATFDTIECSKKLKQDTLTVAIQQLDGTMLWQKRIRVMIVQNIPKLSDFGAVELKLRYDEPISLLDRETNEFSSMPYADGWKPDLNDIVVCLPNGFRFVFWRGASYVPFWASKYNTGLSYEWAETGPLPDGFVDSVEPLMDKELRYGRVEIIESTTARIHVRWTYQSCDFNYKIWGDLAQEDFYFYPDGFGTRVLTLKSAINSDYELSEFIILTPQAAFPLEVLPRNIIDIVSMDGQNYELYFPFLDQNFNAKFGSYRIPPLYRVKFHKYETATAIYYNPQMSKNPPLIFSPFYDKGNIVTPAYWGSHWPLGRGKTTGGSIDNRINFSPSHNSIMTWARNRPKPIASDTLEIEDTLGERKLMKVQAWVWLIGMSTAHNQELLQRAKSYAQPSKVKLIEGGSSLNNITYSQKRQAYSLVVEGKQIEIQINPLAWCVNPVFELQGAPSNLPEIYLNGKKLQYDLFRWDGHTLWIKATFRRSSNLTLKFE